MREAVVKIFSKCPASCVFCDYGVEKSSYGSPVGDPPTEELVRFFNDFRDLGGEVVILSGGETTLRKDFDVVARHAKKLGLFVVLSTAGIGLKNKKLKAKILNAGGIDMVVISIDSLVALNHDKSRGVSNLFSDIEEFFSSRPNEMTNKQFAIRFVVTKRNFRELPSLVDFATKHSLDAVKVTILEGQEANHILLDQSDLKELYGDIKPALIGKIANCDRMSPTQKEKATRAVKAFLAPAGRSVQDIASGRYRPDYTKGCDLPERFTMIKEDGGYLECCQAEYFGNQSVDNVFDTGLKKIRTVNKFSDVRHEYCQFCGEFDAFQISFGRNAEIVEKR